MSAPPRPSIPPAVVLGLSILGISISAPLVRLSNAHPLTVAIWRLGFSLVLIGCVLVVTGQWRQWRSLDRRAVGLALGAGVMLALHFWTWNSSVRLTSIAASVVLVNLHPIIVAILSAVWLHEVPTYRQRAGIAVAVLGVFVVAGGDLRAFADAAHGGRALLGDLLAVTGGVAVALYYVSGRRLRRQLDIWPYVGLVYGACLVTMLGVAAAIGAPVFPQPPREMAIFAALAVGPMMLGHTGMNWALRYLPAYVVSLTVLGEPVGATLLAAVMPGIRETPPPAAIAGGALILTGVLVAAARSREARQEVAIAE